MSQKSNHQIVSCAGYGCTGSSVVTDLLSEFAPCLSAGTEEYRFLYDIDGISNLEHYLVENNVRLVSGHALFRFSKYVKSIQRQYNGRFANQFTPLTEQYISDLKPIMFRGSWLQDYYDAPRNLQRLLLWKWIPSIERKWRRLRGKQLDEVAPWRPQRMMYEANPREEFLTATKKYIHQLLSQLDTHEKYQYLVFDQLVPASNIQRYQRYIDNLKVIVVDRDPRDIYVLNKTKWKEDWIASESKETFVSQYQILRQHLCYEEDNIKTVLRLPFEDFIYNYQATVEKITSFLNLSLDDHKRPRQYFNPDISEENTQVWLKFPHLKKEVDYIHSRLNACCYAGR